MKINMMGVNGKQDLGLRDKFGWHCVVLGVAGLGVVALLLAFLIPLFQTWRLEDFGNTFYPAARHLLAGDNAYLTSYPHPTNGRQYPPYAPIWMLEAMVPLGVYPLATAEAMRFLLDLALLPLLAYLAYRWARLYSPLLAVLLVSAPWHLTELSTGQWTVFVFLGALLCYRGAKNKSAPLLAAGLWLVLAKPHIVILVILASVILAWRARILAKTAVILSGFAAISSLAQPSWPVDMLSLYLDRFLHPRPADSLLLLPGYPYVQFALVALGAVWMLIYLRRHEMQINQEFWAGLVAVSLVASLHSFIYDWMLLMLPIAVLLRARWGVVFVALLYLLALSWAVVAVCLAQEFPSPAAIPSLVLVGLIAASWRPMVDVGVGLAWLRGQASG